jgi:hypothetical protein
VLEIIENPLKFGWGKSTSGVVGTKPPMHHLIMIFLRVYITIFIAVFYSAKESALKMNSVQNLTTHTALTKPRLMDITTREPS